MLQGICIHGTNHDNAVVLHQQFALGGIARHVLHVYTCEYCSIREEQIQMALAQSICMVQVHLRPLQALIC